MIIQKILGGLASQIGKFNMGYVIARSKGVPLSLDLSDYEEGYFRPFLLNKLSGIPDCKIYHGGNKENVIFANTGGELIKAYEDNSDKDIYISKEEGDYKDFFDKYPDLYIGENSPIFSMIGLEKKSSFIESFQNLIHDKISVAVHIRRGDFVTLGWDTATTELKNKIGWCLDNIDNVVICFFSNDIEWVKEEYGFNPSFFYVEDRNEVERDIDDFFCMSMCDYRILSERSCFGKYASFVAKSKYNKRGELDFLGLNNGCYDKCERKEILISPKHGETEGMTEGKSSFGKYDLIFVSAERLDYWKHNGVFGIAKLISNEKNNVLYINVNEICSSNGLLKENTICRARNMDRMDLGFDILYLKNVSILSRYIKGRNFTRLFSDVIIPSFHRYTYIVFQDSEVRLSAGVRYGFYIRLIKKGIIPYGIHHKKLIVNQIKHSYEMLSDIDFIEWKCDFRM